MVTRENASISSMRSTLEQPTSGHQEMVVQVVGDDFVSRWTLTLKDNTSLNDLVRSIYPMHVTLTADMKDDPMSAIFLNWTSRSKGIIISTIKIRRPKIQVVGCPARVWTDHPGSPPLPPCPQSSSRFFRRGIGGRLGLHLDEHFILVSFFSSQRYDSLGQIGEGGVG